MPLAADLRPELRPAFASLGFLHGDQKFPGEAANAQKICTYLDELHRQRLVASCKSGRWLTEGGPKAKDIVERSLRSCGIVRLLHPIIILPPRHATVHASDTFCLLSSQGLRRASVPSPLTCMHALPLASLAAPFCYALLIFLRCSN